MVDGLSHFAKTAARPPEAAKVAIGLTPLGNSSSSYYYCYYYYYDDYDDDYYY